jgi:hypothetical protein
MSTEKLAAGAGAFFLAIAGTLVAVLFDEVKASRPIQVVRQPIPSADGTGFDVGYYNPATTSYRCQWAWFTVDPSAAVLCGAIPAETIVFDGTKSRQDKHGRYYFTTNIADKQLAAGEQGTFDVVIVDDRYAGQTVRGYLQVQYDRNGVPDVNVFPAMEVEIRGRL